MTAQLPDQRTRPRKQPRQARARLTVDAIVEATARILEVEGHAGLTTNAVAERAGVSIGTLYQYFPDKGALLGALIVRETTCLAQDMDNARALPTGLQALDAAISSAVCHQMRRPDLARLLDFEEGRLPLDADTQWIRAKVTDVLADILARPDLPQQPDMAAAIADVAAIIRGMLDAAGERREKGQEALTARVRRAVLGYLSTSGTTGSTGLPDA